MAALRGTKLSHSHQITGLACISLLLFALSALVVREGRPYMHGPFLLGLYFFVKAVRMVRAKLYALPGQDMEATMASSAFLTTVSLAGYWVSHAVWTSRLQEKIFGWEIEGIDPFVSVVGLWFIVFALTLCVEVYWTTTVLIKGNNRQRLLMMAIASLALGQLATMSFLYSMIQGV